MKTGLLLILYTNPFEGLDHEHSYTHLIIFYKIFGMQWVSEIGGSIIPKVVTTFTNWKNKRVVSRPTNIKNDKLGCVGGKFIKQILSSPANSWKPR